MNINVYIEDSLVKRLTKCIKVLDKPRNAAIREAIKEWVDKHQTSQWPAAILRYKGESNIAPFESMREHLLPPKEDPFE